MKLLALELHVADTTESAHRETCIAILSHSFSEVSTGDAFQADINTSWNKTPLNKNKACYPLWLSLYALTQPHNIFEKSEAMVLCTNIAWIGCTTD